MGVPEHHTTLLPPVFSNFMAAEQDKYLGVFKASYDYDPQPDAEDELTIKEGQLLFLLEQTDEECVRSRLRYLLASPHHTHALYSAGGRSRPSPILKKKRDSSDWCPPPTSSRSVTSHRPRLSIPLTFELHRPSPSRS